MIRYPIELYSWKAKKFDEPMPEDISEFALGSPLTISCTQTVTTSGSNIVEGEVMNDRNDDEIYKHIKPYNIVRIMSETREFDIFRIVQVTSNYHNTSFVAVPMYYDVFMFYVTWAHVEDGWYNEANAGALIGDMPPTWSGYYFRPKDGWSNVNEAYLSLKGKNIKDCIAEFISAFGGSVYFEGTDAIWYRDNLGNSELSITLEESVNIHSLEIETNTDEIITKIIPKAYNDIYIYTDEGRDIIVPVDSPKVNDYPFANTLLLSYDDIRLKGDWEDPTEGYDTIEDIAVELRRRANQYFETTKCDDIVYNRKYNVEYFDVTKTDAYIDDEIIVEEVIRIASSIFIKDPEYGKVSVRVQELVWDALNGEIISMQLGKEKKDVLDSVVNSATSSAQTEATLMETFTGTITNPTSLTVKKGLIVTHA